VGMMEIIEDLKRILLSVSSSHFSEKEKIVECIFNALAKGEIPEEREICVCAFNKHTF
jgi:hypothetical protein